MKLDLGRQLQMVLWRGFCRQNPRSRQKTESQVKPIFCRRTCCQGRFDQEPSEDLRKKAAGLLTQAWNTQPQVKSVQFLVNNCFFQNSPIFSAKAQGAQEGQAQRQSYIDGRLDRGVYPPLNLQHQSRAVLIFSCLSDMFCLTALVAVPACSLLLFFVEV